MENLESELKMFLLWKKVETKYKFGDKEFLGFENLTMCPIQTKLMKKSMMTKKEIKWVNEYHKKVYNTLKPFLKDDLKTLEWLKKETETIF